MPLYLQNSRLRNNDQAAAAASTQGVVEDVQRQYREATQPPQPSYALPDLSALGVSSAPTAPSPVMAAIGAIPQIGRRAQQVVQEQAPSWALPTLDSLGVTLQDGRQQPGPSMRPGETLGDVQITSGRRVGTPNGGVEQWSDLVDEASRAYGVPQSIIKGIMDIESGGRADAVSAAGALGLMQVMPFHYQQGEDGMDPRTSVLRGAKILADNYRRWGTWDQAAAAYFGAIDAQGNITGATDATGTDGTNYVRLFRDAANRYGGVPGAAPVMPRLSLNAAPADAPGRAAPPAPGGVSFTPPGAPPAPWEMAGAQDGGQALMKAENDWTGDDPNAEAFRRTNPIQYDEQGQEIHPRFTPGPPNQIRYDIFGNERPADVVPPEWPNWLPVPPNTGDPVISYRQPLGEQEAFLPGDGGYAPTPYEQPYDPDQGPREATPGSVGAQPLPQTDQNYPMTYGPIQQGDVQGPPAPAQSGPLKPVWDAAGRVIGYVQGAADSLYQSLEPARQAAAALDAGDQYGQVQSAGPGEPDYVDTRNPVMRALYTPIRTPERQQPMMGPFDLSNEQAFPDQQSRQQYRNAQPGLAEDVRDIPYQAAESARTSVQEAARAFADALIAGQEGRQLASSANALWGLVQTVALPWSVVERTINAMLPEMNIAGVGVGTAATSMDLLKLGINGVNGLVKFPERLSPEGLAAMYDAPGNAVRAAAGAARTVGNATREGAEAVGRGLQGVGREVAGGLMDMNPAMTPRVIGDGPGIGRSLPGPDDVPTPSSLTPPSVGRPQQRTVEWLAEQIDYTKRVLADLDPATEGELIGQVQDRLARLQGEWVDAVNARRSLEPRIRSEVGRRVNELPIDERTASDYAGIGRERVSPEAGIPRTVDDTPRSPGLNSAVPFDPTSAAMGGAAGAMSEGEDGEAGDPLRTAAGVFIAGLGNSRYGRRFIANAARNAKPGPPPNLWEIMQGFRFSWGMLGNLAQTGLVNAGGGPIELALGLPTEAARMSLLRGRPIGTAHYAIETLSGLKDGARGLLATALGEIPPSVRNAPDFRPPMSERLAGRMGQIGNVDTGAVVGEVIDLPGRLSSQAPDSLWRPLFLRAGAAQERNTIMAENGISKLDPAAQWRELQRLVNNPTPQEAQRIAEASRKYADEMGYKGDPGYLEEKLANLMRGGRIATSKDPLIAQIHEAGGSFVMPFLGAVYKLHKLAATRVPGLGFAANSKLPMDQKLARQAVGAATIYLLADYAAQGMVTGPGPSDPDEAAIVNKKMPPHSTYFPGVGWVPNDSLGSAGPYLNAIGGYYDARRYATEKDKATPGKGDESAVKYVLRGFERFPVVQAAQSVIAMAESPIKGVSDFAANAASSFAPALYRTYQGSQDQYARTVDREAGMDGGIVPALAEQTRQKIVSRVGYAPGLGAREDLQPALDRFGRPIENERQGVSAFLPRVSNPKDDALTDIFTRAGIEPGMPPAEVDKIPLTTEQKREWLRVRGESLAQKQDILSRAADYPEVRRKNVFEAQMSLASDRAAQAVRRMFTPEQRAAARKAG